MCVIVFILQMMVSEGLWLQLDKSSTQSYCHDTNGDAWCLARSISGEVYLRSQAELESAATALATCATRENSVSTTFGDVPLVPTLEAKGFDFTSAARSPVISAFSNVPLGEQISL